MGFFSWLRGEPAPEPAMARRVDVVPGVLTMRITPHALDGREVQAYASAGLAAAGQAEIVLAVARRPRETADALDGPIAAFFRTVHRFATDGRIVGVGDTTELGAGGFIDPRFAGLMYADGAHAGPIASAGSLCAVVVDREELAIAKRSTVHRVLARLGRISGRFPFPPYWDRDRASVACGAAEASSVHGKVGHLVVPGISLTLVGDRLEVRVPNAARARLTRELARVPADAAISLVGAPSPNADAWLVWIPGQSGPSAITSPGALGKRVAGHELLILPGLATDEVRTSEDGFAAMIRATTWSSLRASVLAGDDAELRAGLTLALVATTNEHVSRVDGRVTATSGEWRDYEPAGGARHEGQRVVLLASDAELGAAIGTSELARYITDVLGAAAPSSGAMAIRISLAPSAPPTIAIGPSDDALLATRILALGAPSVRAPLSFEIELG